MTYKGLAKGRIIELEEPLPFCEGQPVTVSIEPFHPEQQPGSPQAILKVLRDLPNIQTEDVDELEQLIKRGSLPIRLEGSLAEKKRAMSDDLSARHQCFQRQ
jgi:hypothetical protein